MLWSSETSSNWAERTNCYAKVYCDETDHKLYFYIYDNIGAVVKKIDYSIIGNNKEVYCQNTDGNYQTKIAFFMEINKMGKIVISGNKIKKF